MSSTLWAFLLLSVLFVGVCIVTAIVTGPKGIPKTAPTEVASQIQIFECPDLKPGQTMINEFRDPVGAHGRGVYKMASLLNCSPEPILCEVGNRSLVLAPRAYLLADAATTFTCRRP